MSVNARSNFLCSREAIKLMLKNHEGAIVNVSSMWGQTGASCEIAYSMSKAAVIGLTRSLAEELAPSGITVNCVCPGIIDTRMNNMFDKNELEEEVPLGRLGTSEEVADAIFYLTQNKYITAPNSRCKRRNNIICKIKDGSINFQLIFFLKLS